MNKDEWDCTLYRAPLLNEMGIIDAKTGYFDIKRRLRQLVDTCLLLAPIERPRPVLNQVLYSA